GTDVDPLTRRIRAISELPEIRLGASEHGQFDPQRVALILRDWVSGVSLGALAEKFRQPEQTTFDFSRYLFSTLLGRASWGLGALENVCLAGAEDAVWKNVGHVPSMIYFGVKSKEAVWLRMVGLPRLLAEGFGDQWRKTERGEPTSFDDIR